MVQLVQQNEKNNLFAITLNISNPFYSYFSRQLNVK